MNQTYLFKIINYKLRIKRNNSSQKGIKIKIQVQITKSSNKKQKLHKTHKLKKMKQQIYSKRKKIKQK